MSIIKIKKELLSTKYFGFIIALFIFILILLLMTGTSIFSKLELKMLDLHFSLKVAQKDKELIQEGVSKESQNPNISQDILLLGIDFKSLSKFGKWPFPRYLHANLIDTLAKIKNQNERERALFIDIFFIDPDKEASHDAILTNSIKNNGHVFLETVLDENPPPSKSENELFRRQELLYENYGDIKNIKGDWKNINSYTGLQPPLQPYAKATKGYGHANFIADYDKKFRRQGLVVRSSRLIEKLKFSDLTKSYKLNEENFEHLLWIDKRGFKHEINYPLTNKILNNLKKDLDSKAPLNKIDTNRDGQVDEEFYVIRKYKDNIIPSITLALAAEYFNKKPSDIEIKLGEYVKIPNPHIYNSSEDKWIPYSVIQKPAVFDKNNNIIKEAKTKLLKDIIIPIDKTGRLLVNFMGPRSVPGGNTTFQLRSYSGYASRKPNMNSNKWPKSLRLANKIIMLGPFSKGMADDEKQTPVGLMYGVEIHANALNTIIMNKFLNKAPLTIDILIIFILVMFTAYMSSRLSTIWSLVASMFMIAILFLIITGVFDSNNLIINFSSPAIGIIFTFITIVVYRVMTEEKDKKRIREMFGKYVSPQVVDEILEQPLELGGVDKDLTVFFSDIRGFTTLSESMTPQELVNHLNLYLTAMTDIILEYHGTLDKYVGDEIMCFWGAPLPQDNHSLLACKCALKQMKVLTQMNEEWPEEKRINIGIGVNSGVMTVGNMGSMGRMNYTLMGDNVNLGARLEGTNKQYLTNIIISENTYGLVKDHVIARELDNIRVKGKNKPVLIYELLDIIDNE